MKIQSPLWALCVMAGLLGCMPAIPRDVTFIDSNPRWSWGGQWEGRGGMTVDFVQEGSHISSRKRVLLSEVNMDAEVTGNRAVGTITTSNPDSPTLASPPDSQGTAATLNTVASALNDVSQKLSGVPFPLSLMMSDDGMFLKGEVSDPITREITFRRTGSPVALTTEQGPSEVSANEPDDDEEAASQRRTAGPEQASPAYNEAMAEWRVRIFDRLGPGQVSETATISIGSVAQTININRTIPSAYAQFNCPNGHWPVSLQTSTGVYNQQGQLVVVRGQGRGTLNCSANGDLEIVGDYSVNPVTAFLRPMTRAQASAPQMGAVPNAPMGASQYSLPAGYYQCYILQVLSGGNSCELGDLQLDGQGNYSSTRGPGGTYVFDPAAGVVSFNGGLLNGGMALAKISNKGTYMLRMRLSGGLPSPRQTFGTYTFEHKRSGHRQ